MFGSNKSSKVHRFLYPSSLLCLAAFLSQVCNWTNPKQMNIPKSYIRGIGLKVITHSSLDYYRDLVVKLNQILRDFLKGPHFEVADPPATHLLLRPWLSVKLLVPTELRLGLHLSKFTSIPSLYDLPLVHLHIYLFNVPVLMVHWPSSISHCPHLCGEITFSIFSAWDHENNENCNTFYLAIACLVAISIS
jgi:hypothetical protein